MDIAEGVHFNDLPEQTSEEKNFKRRAAMAHLIPYLAAIMKGVAFDYDRHGAQSRVHVDPSKPLLEQDISIGIFDPGGMLLEAPSAEAFSLMVGLIDEAFNQQNPRNELLNYLTTRILELAEQHPTHNHYLQGIQKGILSLGDFFSVLEESDFKNLFEILYRNDLLHPDIKGLLRKRFMSVSSISGTVSGLFKRCDESFMITVQRN
jgi:hypothetical protein